MFGHSRGTWVFPKLQGRQYYFPENFRCNLTFYVLSSLHHIFESGNCRGFLRLSPKLLSCLDVRIFGIRESVWASIVKPVHIMWWCGLKLHCSCYSIPFKLPKGRIFWSWILKNPTANVFIRTKKEKKKRNDAVLCLRSSLLKRDRCRRVV